MRTAAYLFVRCKTNAYFTMLYFRVLLITQFDLVKYMRKYWPLGEIHRPIFSIGGIWQILTIQRVRGCLVNGQPPVLSVMLEVCIRKVQYGEKMPPMLD